MTEAVIARVSIVVAICLLFISACDGEKHQSAKTVKEDNKAVQDVQAVDHGNDDEVSEGPPPEDKNKIYLMTVEIGGPYTDSWSGEEKERPDSSSVRITLYREGKSSDFRVDMTINCKDQKYTYRDAIEYEDTVVPANEINDNIPPALPAKAIKTFCGKGARNNQ